MSVHMYFLYLDGHRLADMYSPSMRRLRHHALDLLLRLQAKRYVIKDDGGKVVASGTL